MRHGAYDLSRSEIFFRLTRRVYFCDNDLIGVLECPCKFQEKSFGARIGMWLPHCPNPSFRITSTRAGKRCYDLGGMMGIIIDDADTIHFSAQLEAASRACKCSES